MRCLGQAETAGEAQESLPRASARANHKENRWHTGPPSNMRCQVAPLSSERYKPPSQSGSWLLLLCVAPQMACHLQHHGDQGQAAG